ncbi:MAG TPA: hypothetical protein VNA25_12390 [Phycisphaerae bacterium]|nr:hypothetical protein [Phycisphaerae bacterium]
MTETIGIFVSPDPAARVTDWRVFKGLLWRHWLAGRGLIFSALGVWLAGLWALELFFHPGWMLAFGLVYAFLAVPAFAASETTEGSEEFAFSLPPTRGMRYLAALAMAGAPLVVLSGIGVLAIAGDWPQALWGLVVDSGFTDPFPSCSTFVYPLAVALPLAALAFSFALAALATSRGVATAAGIAGLVGAAAVMGVGFGAESLLWGDLNGVVSVTALLVLGAGALEAGYLLYLRKEGVSRPVPLGGHRLWWLWIAVPVAILLVLAAANAWFYAAAFDAAAAPRDFGPPPVERAPDAPSIVETAETILVASPHPTSATAPVDSNHRKEVPDGD